MARYTGLLFCCLILGVAGYHTPWFSHATAGFTMNGYDLAEWTSLHPAVRSSSPAMLTSFLLRFPHVALVIALALAANRLADARLRWLVRGLAVLLALRLVPPTDFFSGSTDDPNYRQMALLAGVGLVGVAVTVPLFRASERLLAWLLAGVLVAGVVMGWAGVSRTTVLLDNFEIAARVGSGLVAYSLFTILAAVIMLWAGLHRRAGEPT